MSNGQVTMLTGQLKQATDILHSTMDGVSPEIAKAAPGGSANSIAANLAHAITGLDGVLLGMLKGDTPILAGTATGLSKPAPMGGDWGDWGKTVEIDFEAFHSYAGKVIESTQAYLKTLNDSDLERKVKSQGGTEMSVGEWLSIMVLNTAWHTGEIATIKGINNLKGYPF